MSFTSKDESDVSENHLGDRTAHNFNEMIISVPIAENNAKYENLHFVITALINPKETNFGSSTYNAVNLVDKIESRIQSELHNQLEFHEPIAWKNLYKLKTAILHTTRKVFEPQYAKWSLRNKYSIDFVITVFYVSNNIETRNYSRRGHYAK